MVLKPSDYALPEMGENLDPSSPVNFLSRFAGMAVALGALVFALGVARSTVAPAMDSVFSSLTGGIVSSGGSNGGVWEDA